MTREEIVQSVGYNMETLNGKVYNSLMIYKVIHELSNKDFRLLLDVLKSKINLDS